MSIPTDPFILLGFVNMKLRDEFINLDELCLSLDISRQKLEDDLAAAGFTYDTTHNKFW
ncbi:MAG: DUF4250 domain-containing protein [Bacteroidaceae bacterium]|nr:DUF4250 domain-containing protein [Bacteroidaceae bacterium]